MITIMDAGHAVQQSWKMAIHTIVMDVAHALIAG
jgi:hypothetical protein